MHMKKPDIDKWHQKWNTIKVQNKDNSLLEIEKKTFELYLKTLTVSGHVMIENYHPLHFSIFVLLSARLSKTIRIMSKWRSDQYEGTPNVQLGDN